jgi:hypothetical protein
MSWLVAGPRCRVSPPGQHRLLLDTTTADGFGSALLYANNFLTPSQTGYGLKDSDSAVVIVVRHFATVFAFLWIYKM